MAVIHILEKRWIEKFAINLAKAIEKAGIGQAELATRSGLSQATVSKYLSGERSPKLYHAVKLANTLGILLEELV